MRNSHVPGYGRSTVEKSPDPYDNPYTGHLNYVSIFYGGPPVREGEFLIPYLSMNNPLPYDLSVEVRTNADFYKEANYKYQGQDYADMHKTFIIPAGKTQIDLSPIKIHQNPDPKDGEKESFLVELVGTSLPDGIHVGNGSIKVTIVDVPIHEVPKDVYGTYKDDQFLSEPGDQNYHGKEGYDVYSLVDSRMEDITFTELPNGDIEIYTEKYGRDVITYDVEGVFIGRDFKFLPREDIFKPVNVKEGTEYNDILHGTQGNDNISGKGGNDIIIATPGSDSMDGGSGTDILAFFGVNRGDINFSGSANGQYVSTSHPEKYGSDTLEGVELIAFLSGQGEIDLVPTAQLIA